MMDRGAWKLRIGPVDRATVAPGQVVSGLGARVRVW